MSDDYLPDPATNGIHDPGGNARLQNLLEMVCDQSASTSEVEELGSLLSGNKDHREYYLKYLSLHCSLQNYASTRDESYSGDSLICEVAEAPLRRAKVPRWVQV